MNSFALRRQNLIRAMRNDRAKADLHAVACETVGVQLRTVAVPSGESCMTRPAAKTGDDVLHRARERHLRVLSGPMSDEAIAAMAHETFETEGNPLAKRKPDIPKQVGHDANWHDLPKGFLKQFDAETLKLIGAPVRITEDDETGETIAVFEDAEADEYDRAAEEGQ